MKQLQFMYAKEGELSKEREVICMSEPSKHYEGYDVSMLIDEEIVSLRKELLTARNDYLLKITQIADKYGVTNLWKRFSPDKMSDINRIPMV